MSRQEKLPDRVKEPRVVYRTHRTAKDRKAMRAASERMDEIQKRHPRRPGEKDVVTLLREHRYGVENSKWLYEPEPDPDGAKWMERCRKKYAAAFKVLGKSVVELVREERNR